MVAVAGPTSSPTPTGASPTSRVGGRLTGRGGPIGSHAPTPAAVGHASPAGAGCDQVRSLTQLYSVDADQSTIGADPCIFNNHTIKVCVRCYWPYPGPSSTHLTVSLVLCSSGELRAGRVGGPWRAPCQLKKTFKDRRPRRGSCWEEQRRKVFPRSSVFRTKRYFILGNGLHSSCHLQLLADLGQNWS